MPFKPIFLLDSCHVFTGAILLNPKSERHHPERNQSMSKLVVRLLRSTLAVGLCLSVSACVLVHSSAISESTGGGSPVNAKFSDYGLVYLTAPANLTADANAALAKQCQSGMLSNVQTELSMRDWFGIVQYYTVTATAACK
jgi:hypothetical protein